MSDDNAIDVVIEFDDDAVEHAQIGDFDVSVSNDLDAQESRHAFDSAEREVSVSFDVELETEMTVVCRHCGTLTSVPSAAVLELLETDARCHECGSSLGVRR